MKDTNVEKTCIMKICGYLTQFHFRGPIQNCTAEYDDELFHLCINNRREQPL